MSSYAQTSRSHKSKNLRGHDEDSSGLTYIFRNPSKPQFSKILSAPARQSRNPLSWSDRHELQEPTLQRTPIKLFVQPERKTDNEYENEADDDFRPSPQQSFQPAHHGLEENLFEEDEDDSVNDHQSDPKPSRCETSLEERQIDLEMLKEKNRNLELWYAIKRVCTFSGPEELAIPMRSWSIKRPKKEEMYHSTVYANFRSFCHQIESGFDGWTPNKKYKQAKRLLAIEEFDSWNQYRMKKNASKDWLALKDFQDRLLRDRAHWVNTSLLDWMQAKKASNE